MIPTWRPGAVEPALDHVVEARTAACCHPSLPGVEQQLGTDSLGVSIDRFPKLWCQSGDKAKRKETPSSSLRASDLLLRS
jgi:hypothetical protein